TSCYRDWSSDVCSSDLSSPVAEGRNGLPYLVPCLRSHAPVDLLVIYLGTNDAYWLEPIMVARSIGRLVKVARAAEAGPGAGAPRSEERRVGKQCKERSP